jgi:hypothetical protein
LAYFDELSRSGDIQMQSGYNAGLAAIRLAEGNPREALIAAEAAFATRETLGIANQGAKFGFLHALEAAFALGDEVRVNELLEIVAAMPPGLRPMLLEAFAHRFRGHLAGDDPSADRNFTAAAMQLRSLELPFYVSVVQLEHGEWLTARGRPDDAQPLLAEARETFERLEAVPWLDRVDRVTSGSTAEVRA